jgi:hypothetical protein
MKMYEASLSLHYGGNDATAGAIPPFTAYVFTALPLGARCNPAVSGGVTCNPISTLQVGVPLTGSAMASVGGGSPASLMLPSNQLGRITSGSLPPRYSTQIYQKTYVNLANAAGSFQSGGGPGLVSYYPTSPATGVRIFPGKNQFGGVMRLLKGAPSGGLRTKRRSSSYVFNVPSWGATFVGATSIGGFPAVGTVTGTWAHATTPTGMAGSFSGRVLGWPWTTGKVSVRASGDYLADPAFFFPEVLTRAGYDNRTPQGGGTLQLVTPHLVLWNSQKFGAIAVLKLVPEPASGLLLLAGVGLLCVLYRRRAR